MVTLEGNNHIPEFSPEDAFWAGSRTTTWPQNIEGLTVKPKGRELKLATPVVVVIEAPIIGKSFELDAEVTGLDASDWLTVIEGESGVAVVRLCVELLRNKILGGTDVCHTIELTSKKRLLPEYLLRKVVESKAIEFADQHCQNVGRYIEKHPTTATKPPKRKAATG